MQQNATTPENDALDAARYRWLRARCPDLEAFIAFAQLDFTASADAFDALIDVHRLHPQTPEPIRCYCQPFP